ncbi:MAG: glycosyltransferase family 25 protein [Gammaproteobacteria bacterium]|nr:glycosyltransferase family 25 protein [Gammaproteobacteria bacterium]MBU1832728.1 glycosyltransferase family 25 protein [Gammaproteobacteria bacterium]
MRKNYLCCVISLNAEAENTQKLISDLAFQGIAADVFNAVDGRAGEPALEDGESFRNTLAMIRHGKRLTNSELGCYLSHFRAVKHAYDEAYDYVCLIEDDVVIEPLFGEGLNALLDKNLDMVRLMSLKLRRRKVLEPLVGEHYLVRQERGGLGTQSYLLSRMGMKKFLDYAGAIYEPIDKVFDHFFLFDLNVYAVEPHLAYELVGETSVVKRSAAVAAGPNVGHWLAFHPVKLWFSLCRHFYLFRHRQAFSGVEMPDASVGKTTRKH